MEEAERAMANLQREKEEIEASFAKPDSVVTEDWHALHRRYESVKKGLARAEEAWLEASASLEEG